MDQVLSYDLQQIFRFENARADRLAKLATLQMADLDDSIHLETLEACRIEEPKRVLCMGPESRWMNPIIHYLRIRTLFAYNLATHKVKRQASHYVLLDNKLYRRSYSLSLLKCLLPSETDYTIREVHEGIYGNHHGGRALAYKILQQEHY